MPKPIKPSFAEAPIRHPNRGRSVEFVAQRTSHQISYGQKRRFLLEKNAINLLAEKEGIIIDPVYTGRVFGGLLRMIENKEFTNDENVLFWHTGGGPAIFSYASDLL